MIQTISLSNISKGTLKNLIMNFCVTVHAILLCLNITINNKLTHFPLHL